MDGGADVRWDASAPAASPDTLAKSCQIHGSSMTFGLRLSPQHRVYAAFAIYAFCLGNIFPRLPDIKAAMGVREGALGLGLMGTPFGTFVAFTFASPVLDRVGYRRALLICLPMIAVMLAIAVHAPDPLTFFCLLFPVGLLVGTTEVLINVEADRTENLVGHRIMNRAHSFWSIGFFSAAIVGSGAGQLGLSPALHLALVVPVGLALVLVCLGRYAPAQKRPQGAEQPAPLVARPTGAVLVLVVVTLSAVLMEGASFDWSAIYMRTIFAADAFWSGFAVAVFAICQAGTRFFADRFVDKHSPAAVARVLLGVLALGVVVVFLSPSPVVSFVGFASLGVGTSAIFPLAMSAAAQRTDRPAAINVAAVAQFSFVMFLLGPPLLGFVAEHAGIRWTYGLDLPLVLLSLATAGSLGRYPARSTQSAGGRSSAEA